MADPTYPLFPVVAFIGFIISLIPLPWHLQAWNSGTCYYMMWASIACLNQFVNSVVWAGNIVNRAPVWCEISIRITLAASVGLPLSSLCINRRLYRIASGQANNFGRAEKFRSIIIDTLICALLPLIYVALQYIVQGHRFNIFEDIGCYPAVYNTLLAYFISSMWPIVIGLISGTYCTLSLRAFAQRRLQISQFMNSNASSLTMGRYFRLMALAMSEVLLTTPLAIFTIWLNASSGPPSPWVSWEDTHFDYSRVDRFPAILWRSQHSVAMMMEFTRWVTPLCAYVFFAFFGFADEARKNYRKLFSWLIRPLGLQSWKDRRSVKETSSTWEFNTPKTSISKLASSLASPSSILPTYSPPPSATGPILDIKRSTSDITPPMNYREELRDSFTEKAPDYECLEETPTVVSPGLRDQDTKNRSSWRTISVPFFDRRHSSYF